MPFKHPFKMSPRKGKPQWTNEQNAEWRIESIGGGPEGGIPFITENFEPNGAGTIGDLKYTGENEDAWFDGRTVTFNMKVSATNQLHSLEARLVPSARLARPLTRRVRAMRDQALALAKDLDALLEDVEELIPEKVRPDYERG